MKRRIISSITTFALSLSLLSVITVMTAPAANALTTGSGSGLFALIRNETITYTTPPPDVKFSDRCGSTILTTIDFTWTSSNMPDNATCGTTSGSNETNITAMITGYILAPTTATVTFKVRSDDGFYMNINGTNVLSTWADHGAAAVGTYDATGTFSMTEGNIYPVKAFYHNSSAGSEAHLYWNIGSGDVIIPQSNLGLTASDLGTGCAVGESQYCPADNAKQIKALNGTNTNGKYWINVGGTSTNTYVLMDSNIDGGAWMLAMKGVTNAQGNSTTFGYDATYWTTTTTLQSGSDKNAPLKSNQGQSSCSAGSGVTCVTGDDANAKNDVFNYSAATEALVVWPDLTARTDGYRYTGAGTYGFTWKESLTSSTGWSNTATGGVNSSGGCPTTAVTLLTLFADANRCKLRNANSSTPYDARGATVFSSQNQINFFGFNYYSGTYNGSVFKKARFGFGWNENNAGDEGSNDVVSGLGIGGQGPTFGAGDYIGCCQSTTGINRQAGFEFYVRNSPLVLTGSTTSATATYGTSSTPWTVATSGFSTGASASRYIVKPIGTGVDMSKISINSSTGAVSVAADITGGTYNLSVSLIDTYGQIASSKFTLTVADPGLTSLTLKSGGNALTLTPTFDKATTSYSTTVPYSTSIFTVTPIAALSSSTYVPNINGGTNTTGYWSGTESPNILLNYGTNTLTVVVTAADNVTKKTYTVTITREGPPAAPTSLSATAGNGQVTVAFTPGADNGNAITNYKYSIDGTTYTAFSPAVTASPVVITGLTNGTAYTIYLKAVNVAGDSVASASVTSTPVTVPDSPTAVSATSNANTQSVVTWTAPATGGSAITNYYIKYSTDGTAWSAPVLTGSTSASYTYTGLTNGSTYVFQVAAVNAVGTGNYSSSSASAIPATKPGAPTIGTPTIASGTSISVAFTAPASNGGSAITGYTVTSSPGGFIGTGTSSPITVSGLTSGTSYTFTVTATNAAGTSISSSASASIAPATAPGAPTIGTPTIASATSISVPFTAPASNGGSAITGYTVTSSPGGFTGTGTTSPITVSGLTAGTSYTFTVTATNAVGTSASSSASASIIPNAAPTVSSAAAISGTTTRGQTLTVSNGTWANSPASYSYVWQRATAAAGTYSTISGATTNTYVLTVTDVGNYIKAVVTATNSAGSSTSTTAATTIVIATDPVLLLDSGNTSSYSGSGSTWNDLSGNGYNATLVNSPTYSSSNGGVINFSATSLQRAETNIAIPALSQFTVEAWFKLTAFPTGDYMNVVSTVWDGSGKISESIWLRGSGTNYYLDGGFWDATSWKTPYNSGLTGTSNQKVSLNTWYHAVTTYDGTTLKLYLNKSLLASSAQSGLGTGVSAKVRIGQRFDQTTSGYYFTGPIPVVKIYSRAISSTEVTTDFNTYSARYIAPENTVVPVTSGTMAVGQTLSVTDGTWNNDPTSYTYSWARSTTLGGTYSVITGETSNTYTLTSDDSGYFVKAIVTATNTGGSTDASSAASVLTASALTPTFDTPTPTATGFTVQINNYDANYTWAGTATASGSVTVSGTGLVTVTGVAPGTSSTATITTTRANYTSGSGTVSATSITGAALNPSFGTPTATADGFTVQISNFSASYTWAGTATASGTVTVSGTGLVTVTGVAPGTSSTATITTTRTGYSNGSNTVTGTSTARASVTNVTSTNTNGYFVSGSTIAVTVTFSRAVTVTGTPQITLETGTTDRTASYASGSGTTTLTFYYTVQTGDVNSDLDYLSTSALSLNGGSIKDSSSVDVTLTLPSPGTAGSLGANKALVVDAAAPTITNVTSSTADGSYKAGSTVSIQVTFSENVTVALGTPYLTLAVGSNYNVNYVSGSGTNTLTFNYAIQSGHSSSDLSYASTSSLSAYTSTMTDAAGNNAILTLPTLGAAGSLGANKAIVVDAVTPTVTSVTSDLANGSYKVGQVIPIKVVFNEAVTVTGVPILGIRATAGVARALDYASGSGTTTLIFNYTVQAGDISSDLDYYATTSLSIANGGSIADAVGNSAVLTLVSPGAAGSLGANKAIVIDTVTPTVNSVSSSLANGSYTTGQVIPVTVTFSESVIVTGSPTISLNITNNGVLQSSLIATYSSGSGTSTLTFNYTVQAGDSVSDLDYASTTSIQLNSGTIADAAGNSATLTLATPGATGSLGANKAIVIDTTAPTISSVSATASTYGVGGTVDITVRFSKSVTVSGAGSPQLLLETGATDRYAIYRSGDGTSSLIFRYTVQAGDASSDLNYVDTASLGLNSGTIKDAAGNDAVLILPALASANSIAGAAGNVIIDTIAPTVVSVTSTTTNGTYKAGDSITIKIVFSEVVNVGATGPTQVKLKLETGSTDQDAVYSIGSASTTLTFGYTVQAGDTSADLDYISSTALSVGSSYIRDNGANLAVLTLPDPGTTGSLGANKAIVIDTTVPATPTNLTLSASSDTGSSNSDRITRATALTFTGVADVGATIQLKDSSTNTGSTCVTAADSVFTCTTGTLSAGVHTISAFATNAAGTSSTTSTTVSVTIDTTAPTKSSVTVWTSGATIAIVFSEDLSTTTAAASQFAVTAAGTSISVTSVTATSTTITLALASRILSGQAVTLAYTDPTAGDDASAAQDIAGNDVVGFSVATGAIANNSTITAPTFSAPSTGLTATAMNLYTLAITSASGGSGDGTFTYSVTGGLATLTSYGLALDSTTPSAIKIIGTPNKAGSITGIVLTVTDSIGVTKSTNAFTITVISGTQLPISIATVFGTGGQALSLVTRGGSGTGAFTYTVRNGTSTTCSLSGATLTATTAVGVSGICYVTATKAADTAFTSSSSPETTIFFTAYIPVITQSTSCSATNSGTGATGIGTTGCQPLAPVTTNSGDSGAAPKITSLSISSGLVGVSVTITGTGFATVTKVQFGGKSTASFTATATTIAVEVPVGATTGRVMVFSPTGTAMASQIFTVISPDVRAPSFLTGNVNTSTPTQIALTFDENIANSGVLANAFGVSVAGSSRTISAVTISGTTVTLTLASAVTTGQAVVFTYTSPGDSTSIQDSAGNKTATITATAVTNTL